MYSHIFFAVSVRGLAGIEFALSSFAMPNVISACSREQYSTLVIITDHLGGSDAGLEYPSVLSAFHRRTNIIREIFTSHVQIEEIRGARLRTDQRRLAQRLGQFCMILY
jgi:hypothetical protein